MFETLTGKLGEVFDRLKRRGALSEIDVSEALREVRVALLEADVALPVVKDLLDRVAVKAVGEEVIRSVTPAQMVIKIVHDELVEILGREAAPFELKAVAPAAVLLVGLQGSGKTTTAAKLALRLHTRERKKILMASLDTRRPAAQEQLAVLGRQASIATLPVVAGEDALQIADRAMDAGRREGFDVVILDTAGRMHVDEELMDEAAAIEAATNPAETLLVADAMTGQDAVNVAARFSERLKVTGIILTRADGDARGGAALSMRAVTNRPIKFLGVGEKMDALEVFHPERAASRILGMGDILGLVERAAESVDREQAEKIARKAAKQGLDLEDYAAQLAELSKMGGISALVNMLPGVGKIQKGLAAAGIDNRVIVRQRAIIGSMTCAEKRDVKLLNASRKRRIAAGSGTRVEDVNRLVKQFLDMNRTMKQMGKLGQRGMMRHGLPGFPPR
jgi:signal recognition particle subunit SRP54